MNLSLLLIVSVIMIIGGLFMQFAPPNKFFGLRTPATLSGDNVWKKANKLIGKIYAIAGLCILIITLIANHIGWEFWLNKTGEIVLLLVNICILVLGWVYGEILAKR